MPMYRSHGPRARALFRGKNFMTPDPVAYFEGHVDGRRVYVELSSGDFNGRTIFGVTVRRADGGRLDPDPSRGPFNSYSEAYVYIASTVYRVEEDDDEEEG